MRLRLEHSKKKQKLIFPKGEARLEVRVVLIEHEKV